ncbi:mechanosensitive ion channel family protein [Pedobacter sp. MW01-1-1]|uniref:mechanosensitive ion channel family protein n=1 Tax=Pedobacter sp. MW01-1-1 TaxID=3383027 RepID=UPI003FEE9B22
MDLTKATDLISEEIMKWVHGLIRLLPNIVLAAIVFTLGLKLAGYIKGISRKLIIKFSDNRTLCDLFASIIYIVFIGIILFIVLSILNLDKAVTSILAGAGILGLALAFAFQDIAANFMSGIFISFRRPLRFGDIVSIKGYMGKVVEINLRDTAIMTFQGKMVIIPNKEVFQNPIENYSKLGKRRIDLNLGVSYGEDLEAVKKITLQAVADIPGLCESEEPSMFYQEFSNSSINFTLRLWVNSVDQVSYLSVWDAAIIRIKKAYDQHNIVIPFPIMTMDFGIKGGKGLHEVLADPTKA